MAEDLEKAASEIFDAGYRLASGRYGDGSINRDQEYEDACSETIVAALADQPPYHAIAVEHILYALCGGRPLPDAACQAAPLHAGRAIRFRAQIEALLAAERERCAKVAERPEAWMPKALGYSFNKIPEAIAAAIRSLPSEPGRGGQ